MYSLKEFLRMKTVHDIEAELIGIGYSIKKKIGNTITVGFVGDRVGALQDIAKHFNGRYNPKQGGSAGRAELPGNVKVLVKPLGGGSGAGSELTTLGESAQCLYCAAAWYGNDFTGDTLRKVASKVDIDDSIDNIINKLPDPYIKSCILIAQTLKQKHGSKQYKFHRGSSWVKALSQQWNLINRQSPEFANINKWSPADIYMVSMAGEAINFSKANTFIELNEMLKQGILSGDIIGVSLKQVRNTVKYEVKNLSSDRHNFKFIDLTVGKRGFFESKDGYLYFDGGTIQFRTFGTTWQGEIKGKLANMGKISGGPINRIVQKISGHALITQSELNGNRNEDYDEKMYEFYKKLAAGPLDYNQFKIQLDSKDTNFWLSKFLTSQLLSAIKDLEQEKRNDVVTAMISYAASESELSAPYVKVS